jgi:hypothetical protein
MLHCQAKSGVPPAPPHHFQLAGFPASDLSPREFIRQKSASAIALNFAGFCKSNGEPMASPGTNPTGRSHVPDFGVKVRANQIRTIFSWGNLADPPSSVLKISVGYDETRFHAAHIFQGARL